MSPGHSPSNSKAQGPLSTPTSTRLPSPSAPTPPNDLIPYHLSHSLTVAAIATREKAWLPAESHHHHTIQILGCHRVVHPFVPSSSVPRWDLNFYNGTDNRTIMFPTKYPVLSCWTVAHVQMCNNPGFQLDLATLLAVKKIT